MPAPLTFTGRAPISSLLTGLVAYWKLDEASGTRADSVGANTLTDNNTVTQAVGKVGSAAQFTAASLESLSIVDNADVSAGDIDFTIAGWVFLDSVGATRAIAVKGSLGAIASDEYGVFVTVGNSASFFVEDQAGTHFGQATTGAALTVSTWAFVVAWHDSVANTVNCQLNNGTVASSAYTFGVKNGTNAFALGATTSGGASYMNGRIDEVGFWKRVLTVAERTSLYNAGSGVTYPFS